MKITVIIFIALSIFFVSTQACPCGCECDKNEEHKDCEPCVTSCGQPPDTMCTMRCQNPGCYCKNGFLRKNGVCVPQNEC